MSRRPAGVGTRRPPATGARRPAYRTLAPVYDLLSAEWPVYRAGRRSALQLLDLQPGEQVLELGCGTGLNLPGVRAGVGRSGGYVGVDLSRPMLEVAGRRAGDWPGVHLVAADLDAAGGVLQVRPQVRPGGVDVLLATYALSLLPAWRDTLADALTLTCPGARLAVVDMQPARGPVAGRLLARLAMRAGGADPQAHPWTAVEQRCTDVRTREHWAGHVQVRVGTLSRPGGAPPG